MSPANNTTHANETPEPTAAGASLAASLARLRGAYAQAPAPSRSVRAARLARLMSLLQTEAESLLAAIDADFDGRSPTETRLIELFPALEAVRHAQAHLRRWLRPTRRRLSIWFWPARGEVRPQPLGVVGIVVPWNYPLLMTVGPLSAALAAGNHVMIKLSELAPNFSRAFAAAVARHFAADEVMVVEGDASVAQAFVALPFDHLLFTGSTAVGRQVMAAAARNLTPVTLELGGKSPVFVGPDADLPRAASRIVFGKLINAGQTCVAPDYVLVPHGRRDDLVAAMQAAARRMYGDVRSADYASLISVAHQARLRALVDDAVAAGAHVVPLLGGDPGTGRKMAPVLLLDVDPASSVMQEEIFGPVLPILAYRTLAEAIDFVRARPRPLALYVFDAQATVVEQVLARTHSGGVGVNDCVVQVAQEALPFGGVGPSGMGHYHGHAGFLTFSHQRAIFRQAALSPADLLRPPFGRRARVLLRVLTGRS